MTIFNNSENGNEYLKSGEALLNDAFEVMRPRHSTIIRAIYDVAANSAGITGPLARAAEAKRKAEQANFADQVADIARQAGAGAADTPEIAEQMPNGDSANLNAAEQALARIERIHADARRQK